MTIEAGAAETYLREIGAATDAAIDLAGAALMFAALDRPRVSLDRYRHHLDSLGGAVAAAGERRSLEEAIGAINQVLYEREGYDGDRLTYDDLQNANLMRVIDRRRGLPVSLGILYIHTARAQGWQAVGLCFPGHFLLRLEGAGERAIIDPFDQGEMRSAVQIRDLLKSMAGQDVELDPDYFEIANDRKILIRLQTNIKLRHLQNGAVESACRIAERLLWIAPNEARLWQDYGMLEARLGRLDMAIAALETCIARSDDPELQHSAACLLQEIATPQS